MHHLRCSAGMTLVGWILLGTGLPVSAQTESGWRLAGTASLRSDWQQRVLGGHAGASKVRSVPAQQVLPAAAWTPPDTVSTTSGSESVPADVGQMLQETEIFPDIAPLDVGPVPAVGAPCATCGAVHGPIGPECASCGGCGDPCDLGCGLAGPCFRPWPHHLSLSLGVHGFKGPPDQGVNGNFGFNEGVNWSAAVSRCGRLGYQVGFQTAQSNIEGDQVAVPRTADRDQMFLTAGLFRRAVCQGWQGGIAYDYLHDRYYYGSVDLGQLRAELSWLRCNRWEFGFWGAFNVADDQVVFPAARTLESTDQYAFFYRQRFGRGGAFRLWAGFTGRSDGLVGANLTVPLGRGFALENNFNYLVPNQDSVLGGQTEESWGAALRLVWYPCRSARCDLQSPFHSLFNVADNSVFMVDFR